MSNKSAIRNFQRKGVIGWVFITFWKMRAHCSGNLTSGWGAQLWLVPLEGESVALYSLFPSLILSSFHGSNRYFLRVHHEPLQGHQQSGRSVGYVKGYRCGRRDGSFKSECSEEGTGCALDQRRERAGDGFSWKDFSIPRQVHPTRG